jgi:hypothetical protein
VLRALTVPPNRHKSLAHPCNPIYFYNVKDDEQNKQQHKPTKTFFMKRFLFTLTILCSLISFSSFANPTEKIASRVLQAFNNSFKNAANVEWTIGDNFYKASFQIDEQYVNAFYSIEGEMIAVTKRITSTQLPVALQTALKEETQSAWITDLFEIANEEGTSYYVTVENADQKLVLKSEGSSWTSFKKYQKS